MSAMLAALEFSDYAIIALLIIAFGGVAFVNHHMPASNPQLEREVREMQRKLDALLKCHGIKPPLPPPSGPPRATSVLDLLPEKKIAATTHYPDQKPQT